MRDTGSDAGAEISVVEVVDDVADAAVVALSAGVAVLGAVVVVVGSVVVVAASVVDVVEGVVAGDPAAATERKANVLTGSPLSAESTTALNTSMNCGADVVVVEGAVVTAVAVGAVVVVALSVVDVVEDVVPGEPADTTEMVKESETGGRLSALRTAVLTTSVDPAKGVVVGVVVGVSAVDGAVVLSVVAGAVVVSVVAAPAVVVVVVPVSRVVESGGAVVEVVVEASVVGGAAVVSVVDADREVPVVEVVVEASVASVVVVEDVMVVGIVGLPPKEGASFSTTSYVTEPLTPAANVPMFHWIAVPSNVPPPVIASTEAT